MISVRTRPGLALRPILPIEFVFDSGSSEALPHRGWRLHVSPSQTCIAVAPSVCPT